MSEERVTIPRWEWPWVSKKFLRATIDRLMAEQKRMLEAQNDMYIEQLEETRATIDTFLKANSTLEITRDKLPPYDYHVHLTIGPHIVMKLRDPAVTAMIGPRKQLLLRNLCLRLAFYTEEVLARGLSEGGQEWLT